MNQKNLDSMLVALNAFSPFPVTVYKYSASMKDQGTGWGCWYFEVGEDNSLYKRYATFSCGDVAGHSVTFAQDGLIGFDLGHSWCNPSHDLSYVRNEIAKGIADLKAKFL